ncbi:MAG TPA: sulfatase-like hydrolase/transferase [Terriglobales bacterium]|nr:sulfatase-like hydrolase/transferase [Terriglobales bacterium]
MRLRGFLFFFLWVLATTPYTAAQTQPDVVLITIDTLRADHVGCYGYGRAQTPALDRLCRDGIRFSQAFTPSPITNTSHASILTGLLPSTHGVTDFGVPLGAAHATWAQMLKQRGYRTAAFIGAVILDSSSLAPGLDRGFDFYDNFPNLPKSAPRWGRVERRGMDVVERAIEWMGRNRSGPRFLWVHLFDPHDPYEPPAPYDQLYKNSPYDGEIAYADAALGRLLTYLDRQARYRSSLVVVVGDHGEGLGEHGEETHGIFLYDSTLHVPLIVKLPGAARAGTVNNNQVRTIDILPTVLAQLQLPIPKELQGRSLTPSLKGESLPEIPAIGETDYPLRFGWAPLRSVRWENSKFIEAPRPEFYDLVADPGETRNGYEPWNPQVQAARALLAEFRAGAEPGSAGKVPQETLEHLKALGYLGSDPGQTNVPEPSLLPDPKDKIELQNLLHRALMADEGGRPDVARAALEKAIALDETSAVAFLQLGQIELAQGDYAKAAQHLARARALRSNDAAAAWYHGQALEKLNDLAGARDALNEALRLAPGQYDARVLLGRVYARLGDAAAARDQFEAATLLRPKAAAARVELARMFLAEKRYADAASQLERASQGEAPTADVYRLLAESYRGLGRVEEAKRAEAQAASLLKENQAP